MIAFTNHALDHMLTSVLDAGITKKIVRLGGRSTDERISKLSMENIEKVAGPSRFSREFANNYRQMKGVEEEIKALTQQFAKAEVNAEDIMNYIEISNPELHMAVADLPPWIDIVRSLDNQDGSWTTVGRGGQEEESDNSAYTYWRTGKDLDFLFNATVQPSVESATERQDHISNMFDVLSLDDETSPVDDPQNNDDSDDSSESDEDLSPEEEWLLLSRTTSEASSSSRSRNQQEPQIQPVELLEDSSADSPSPHGLQSSDFNNLGGFFAQFGYASIPTIPFTCRPVEELLLDSDAWLMSRTERDSLHSYLMNEVRVHLQNSRVDEYQRLRRRHTEVQAKYREDKDEVCFTGLRRIPFTN